MSDKKDDNRNRPFSSLINAIQSSTPLTEDTAKMADLAFETYREIRQELSKTPIPDEPAAPHPLLEIAQREFQRKLPAELNPEVTADGDALSVNVNGTKIPLVTNLTRAPIHGPEALSPTDRLKGQANLLGMLLRPGSTNRAGEILASVDDCTNFTNLADIPLNTWDLAVRNCTQPMLDKIKPHLPEPVKAIIKADGEAILLPNDPTNHEHQRKIFYATIAEKHINTMKGHTARDRVKQLLSDPIPKSPTLNLPKVDFFLEVATLGSSKRKYTTDNLPANQLRKNNQEALSRLPRIGQR